MPEKRDREGVIDRVRGRTRDAYDYGKEKIIHAKERTEGKIKEHPFESVLIAAGVGALIGAGVALWVSSMTRKRS
jgi:ElaB/YqjD/DUF883 family membrane-anchored ribosome-binding protein